MFPCSQEPIARLKNWKGWYNRGDLDDVPLDHFSECLNCSFSGKDTEIRAATAQLYAADQNVASYFSFSAAVIALSGAGKFNVLYMDLSGNLYTASTTPNTLLKAFTGANGFAALEAFGRVYITPTLNGSGLVGEFTYYWDGTNFAEVAGAAPSGGVTLAQANPGIVNAGVHGIYVSFLYRTGYLSPPSPVTNITSTGSNDIEVSNIPTGGAGVVGRVILMTQSGQLTPFFVPGGTINDNTTTTFTINVYDNALLSSADYLNDVLPTVPSCSDILFYSGRILLIGRSDFPFILLWSDVGIYDSFNNINNIQNVPRDNNLNAPNTGAVINSVCYIFKPFGTYYTQDNGQVPNLWPVVLLDPGLGTYKGSISSFNSGLASDDVLDNSFVVNSKGLLLFNGNYSDIPLTYKIDNYWKSIASFPSYNLKIANDAINKVLYIVTNDGILFMDYTEGATPQTVKWSLWTFDGSIVGSIFTACNVLLNQTGQIFITVSTMNGSSPKKIWYFTPNFLSDFGNTNGIAQFIQTASVLTDEGSVTCFNGLRFRVSGTSAMQITLYDEDGNNPKVAPSFNLNSYTSQDLFRLINFTNEKMMVSIQPAGQGNISLTRLDVFGNKQWQARPALTQAS